MADRFEKQTAIHEAGHAVALRYFWPQGRVSGSLSIVPGQGRAGFHQEEELAIPADDHSIEADHALHNQAVVYCAGYAACIAAGYPEHEAATGCVSDFAKVPPDQLDATKREAVELMRRADIGGAVACVADELMIRKYIDADLVGRSARYGVWRNYRV